MINDTALNAFAAATNGELYDLDLDPNGEIYGWMVEAVETQESIADFVTASEAYSERTAPKHGVIAGFQVVSFREVQLRRGATRRPLSVVDFGTARFVLDADLSVWF